MMRFACFFLFLVFGCFAIAEQDELIFVMEICRHGARAPLTDELSKNFTVGTGKLTPSGMRQHYLLGRFLRKKYIDDMKFLSPTYKREELHVSSTHIERTVESARSHLLGLYPPESNNKTLKEEKLFKTLPEINLSKDYDTESIYALPSKYEAIAVKNNEIKRDTLFATGACTYLYNQMAERRKDKEVWTKLDEYFKPKIYKALARFFNKKEEEIDYVEAYNLGDALIAMEYEGHVAKDEFTEEEWEHIYHLQFPFLINLFTPLGNRLVISKLMNPVIEFMNWKVGREFDSRQTGTFKLTEKYMYHSSHDLMISNFLIFLKLQNLEVDYVDFASNFIFELYKKHGEADSYYVKTFYNNKQVQIRE